MKTYVVQLESHDDVISARDKISWSKARRVLLVWPRYGNVLERRVDLLLLLRHCQQTGSQLAVISNSGEVKYHARALGIPVFRKVEQAQKSAWRRSGILHKEWRTGKSLPLPSQTLREQRMQLPLSEAFQTGLLEKRWLRLALFTLAVLSFLLLVLSFAPGARVSLKPVREPQELSLAIWASPDIRAPNPSGGLPAHILSVVVEGRSLADSSGRTLVPERYAAGQVQLTNLTDQPVSVLQGSIVFTSSVPVTRFRTTRPVMLLPGPGKRFDVPVQAVLPGRAGNARANQIQAMEGPLGQRLSVANPLPLTGGSDRSSPAPSREDYRRLREDLLLDLRGTALEELNGLLAPGQLLLGNSLRVRTVITEDEEPAVDYPAERLQLTMRVEIEGWYVEESDLEAVARTILDASLPEGFRPVPGSFQVEFIEEPYQAGSIEGPVVGNVHRDVVMRRMVEAEWVEAQLVQAIQGRKVEDALQILQRNLHLEEPPMIELYPDWWGRMPFLPVRIALDKQ